MTFTSDISEMITDLKSGMPVRYGSVLMICPWSWGVPEIIIEGK